MTLWTAGPSSLSDEEDEPNVVCLLRFEYLDADFFEDLLAGEAHNSYRTRLGA
ncbi:hypothetical protein [Comamonas sp. UBA7528]|uniref:hypothetical protein n=1 Tax=Comamonas sp. UBA7528 TaxID=1946391 RepID=UPI0025C47E69|nr:hypothetical protein [Comamonas sp. UBA7528]